MKINYHNRTFKGVTNSASGQVSGETVFTYVQHGDILTATYQGGSILQGHMIGHVLEDNSLVFVYHHVDVNGALKSGHCTSVPEILQDGRIRLHETWEWDHGGNGKGQSVVEEE